ncbi:MAG: ribosome maturation factor RimM [Candidatus Dormibacteria bacterium]
MTLRVGRVAGARGLRGELKVEPLTDNPHRFVPGSELLTDGRVLRVSHVSSVGPLLMVTFDGVTDRDAAQSLVGKYLEIETEPELPAGLFYHHQLVGLRVVDESGAHLGTVRDVIVNPANDVLEVKGDVERLVPMTRDAVARIDLVTGILVARQWVDQRVDT